MQMLATVSAALTFPAIDPVIIALGPLQLRWYSLAYIVGIIIGWQYAKKLVTDETLWRNGQSRPGTADLDDFIFWAVIGIVVGGRLGYVVFYNPAYYIENLPEIFAVWQGGMSFHGGLLGMVIAMHQFARSRDLPVWSLFDVIAAVAPIGIFFGRLANFINSELWGRVTDVPWAVYFPNGGAMPRHPSQIYEACLEGIVLLLILRAATHAGQRFKTPGFITGLFAAGYGMARFFVEYFREPDAQIGYLAGDWLTMGMLLSTPMIIGGLLIMRWAANRK